MARPRDTTPAYNAIVEALTTFTGMPRCIPRENLYRLAFPKYFAEGAAPAEVFRSPLCFVAPFVPRPIDAQLTMSDRSRCEIEVEIRCFYFAPELNTNEWRATMARIAKDTQLVRDALSYPGNLERDRAGDDTGLDGYSLPENRWDPRPAIPLPSRPQVYQLTHMWKATVELARAAIG